MVDETGRRGGAGARAGGGVHRGYRGLGGGLFSKLQKLVEPVDIGGSDGDKKAEDKSKAKVAISSPWHPPPRLFLFSLLICFPGQRHLRG
eukprot:764467-Hanusia_phi.AAC.2